MYKLFLSWRYMRRRRTNLIGIVGICVGVGALILILSIMSGFLAETRRSVRGSLADLIISPAVDVPRRDGTRVPDDPAALLDAVRADPRVAGASAQLQWFGVLTLGGRDASYFIRQMQNPDTGGLAGVRLVGVDAADEFEATELREALERTPRTGGARVADAEHPFATPPGYRPSGRPLASAIVGEQLAQQWGLERGQEIHVYTAVVTPGTDEVRANDRRYVVAGTFRSRENEMDLSRIYLERAELADFLGLAADYSQVLVRLHDYERDGRAVREDLERTLIDAKLLHGGLTEVRTWEQYKQTLLGAIENEKVLMAIMLSLVLVVAGFTVFAILSMMVTEKRRDIGILCALGAPPRGIVWLFTLIGFWDALLGAGLGALLGTLGALNIDGIERWLSRAFGVQIFNRNVYIFDHIPAVVEPLPVALIVLGAFVCTLVFAFGPAWRAGRMHPLDALRYE